MAPHPKINRRWFDGFCIVAASGPSLTAEVAEQCRGYRIVVVNDAYRLLPFADVLYACDGAWWDHHDGVLGFAGEKWSSHGNLAHNNKLDRAERYRLELVKGADGSLFSVDPACIHYGDNGGFQSINLAAHFLGFQGMIALVGFDMRRVEGRSHFFGEHPSRLKTTSERQYATWIAHLEKAAKAVPDTLRIVNCTPGSALRCFAMSSLSEVLPVKEVQRAVA